MITTGSCLGHAGHNWVTVRSRLCHVLVMLESCLGHAQVILESFYSENDQVVVVFLSLSTCSTLSRGSFILDNYEKYGSDACLVTELCYLLIRQTALLAITGTQACSSDVQAKHRWQFTELTARRKCAHGKSPF